MKRTASIGALCALFALSACGGSYSLRVPSSMVKKLPYDARIDLLEAENTLAIALDKVDVAKNEISRTHVAIRRAKKREGAADDQVDDAKDASTRQVAKLAEQEAEARIHYLEARQDVNATNLDYAQLALKCARARYEVARMEAARHAKVPGSEDLDPKAFHAQVKRCDSDLAEEKKDEPPDSADLAKAKQAWEKRKDALAQKTFTTRASPYVE